MGIGELPLYDRSKQRDKKGDAAGMNKIMLSMVLIISLMGLLQLTR